MLSGKEERTRLRYISKDGAIHWVQDNARPIMGEEGHVTRIVGATADISDLKQTENDLLESRRRNGSMLESIGDGFMAVDAEWNVEYLNAMAEHLWDIRRDNVIGRSI